MGSFVTGSVISGGMYIRLAFPVGVEPTFAGEDWFAAVTWPIGLEPTVVQDTWRTEAFT